MKKYQLIRMINSVLASMSEEQLADLYNDISPASQLPLMIPESVMLREAREQIGVLQSEIEELKDYADSVKREELLKESRKIKREELYKNQHHINSLLQKRIKALRKTNEELVVRLCQLERKMQAGSAGGTVDEAGAE